MLVINSIEKTRLSADSYRYSGTGVAWKARLVLFLGFALMAGGLAGSVVSSSRAREWVSTGKMLIEVCAGCVSTQVHRPGLPFPNLIFWCCQCRCKWVDHAEVLVPCVSAWYIANSSSALWYSGFRKIWRTIIPTIWLFEKFRLDICTIANEISDSYFVCLY